MMTKLAAALSLLTFAGCASENDGALHISARLADPSSVTHIVATDVSTRERIVFDMKTELTADGGFDIALPAGKPWLINLIDATKSGAAMRRGTLQSAGIDAFNSKDGGALDFGTLYFTATHAHGTMTWENLEKALGHDRATLERMAKLDNLALRYSNPDVDNDGQVDAMEDHDFRLELAGAYRMETMNGATVTIGDLVRPPVDMQSRYLGTTIETAVPAAMGINMASGGVVFEQPFYGTVYGPNTPMIAPNTRITAPHVKFGKLDGTPVIGVTAHPMRNAPSGTYRFGFDSGELTFTDVYAPAISAMAEPTDYAIPFIRIHTVDPSCVQDCEIRSIDVEWRRSTASGWQVVAPTDAHFDFVSSFNGKTVNLAGDLQEGATSLVWNQLSVAGAGILRSELPYLSSMDLCYMAVTFTSELGMKMTGQFTNPSCP